MSKKNEAVQTSEQVMQGQQTLEQSVQQSAKTSIVENPIERKQALANKPADSSDLLLKNLNECTSQIQRAMTAVAKSFLYIGFRLWECREDKTYEALGFKNVYEYGESILGFKKTSTANFINVCLRFSEKSTENGLPTYNIHKSVENFSYSQLVEMLSLGSGEAEKVTADMTVKDIRRLKSGADESEQQKVSISKSKTYTLVLPVEIAAQLDAFVQANRIPIENIFLDSLMSYLKSFKAPAKPDAKAPAKPDAKAPAKPDAKAPAKPDAEAPAKASA